MRLIIWYPSAGQGGVDLQDLKCSHLTLQGGACWVCKDDSAIYCHFYELISSFVQPEAQHFFFLANFYVRIMR